jgi:glycosyltransferase involved in cell wall biosynthesis
MRILAVGPDLPFPPIGGGPLRTYHLLRALAARHDVTLVGFTWSSPATTPSLPLRAVAVEWSLPGLYADMADPDPVVAAAAVARGCTGREPWFASYYQSASMAEALRRVAREPFDVVVIEHSIMGLFRDCLPAGVPRLLDLHNVHSAMFERRADADLQEFARTLDFERMVVDASDVCVTVSRLEADAARRLLQAPDVRVVPNGVDTAFFTPAGDGSATGTTLLFTGLMSYEPNVEAVRYFAGEILPLVRRHVPDARLSVVGARPAREVTALASAGVTVHGFVPDTRPHYRDAAVVVVPLLHGGGTRLKILEAAASGKAIVTTSVGVEGLDFQADEDLLVADSAPAFAEAVVALAANPARRRELGWRARGIALRYDWEAIGAGFCGIAEEVARGVRCPT